MPPIDPPSQPALTVLVPVYNDAASLRASFPPLLAYLQRHVPRFEVLLVDDASTDDSAEVIAALAREHPGVVRSHRHDENHGPCSALRTGPRLARGEYTLLLPADLAIPVEDIAPLWAAREGADIILGYIGSGDPRSLRRRLQSSTYTRLFNLLFDLDVRQVNYVALYRTEVVAALPLSAHGVALHGEVLARAARAGAVITQVPLRYVPRTEGQASGGRPRVIAKTVREILAVWRDLRAG